MKKVLAVALCALFAGVVAAAPAKKIVTAEKPVAVAEDCTQLTDEKAKTECMAKAEAEKAAAETKTEEKKTQ